jgi:CubicO group peptidase (beta-lactamase class C family)
MVILLLALIYGVYSEYPKLTIISGLNAKWVASGVFVANRTQEEIELTDNNFSPVNWATNKVNEAQKAVVSNVFGLNDRKAIYREGLGTVVINDDYNPNEAYLVPNRNKIPKKLPFPYGDLPQKDTVFINIKYSKLDKVVNEYFKQSTDRDQTRSLLVVYKNRIIVEKYLDGFDKTTKILGWSMGKSIVSTIIGVLNLQGRMDINDAAPIDEWRNDERSKITINNLLQMNSGLAWEEDYTKISDVTKMLYLDTDMTQAQINKPLITKSNEHWLYSSGTSNLLSGIVRKQFKTHQEYLDFWYSDLIDKMGMHSMLLETDLAGNYVASSYAWANTRDWAKYGLLYLNKGNWNGEQIISKDWVKYTSTPTNTSEGIYGAQFWLNAGGHFPDVPKDMFMADGFQGQRIFIIPSKDLVVVRTGITDSQMAKKIEERGGLKPNENKEVVEYELGNQAYNNLLKEIISTIN